MGGKTISRLDFVKKTSQASAGLLLGGLAVGGIGRRSRIIGANDRVNVGIVGFSDRAKRALIPCLLEHAAALNFDIAGVSDIWKPRREEGGAFLEKLCGHRVRQYRNNDELYDDGDIDAVIVSTPDFQHARNVMEAARNGRDLYIEKPFAETMEENRRALRAVEKAGIVVQVGLQRRSDPRYRAACDYLHSGAFGEIVLCEMTRNINQPDRWLRPERVSACRREDVDWERFLGDRPREAFDPRKYVEYRLFRPYSSGIPGQWMSHQADLVHWFTGLKRPRGIAALGGTYRLQDGRTNFDTLTAVLDYGPADRPGEGFQAVFSSRFTNSAGGEKEAFYSNIGTLYPARGRATDRGRTAEDRSSDVPATELFYVDSLAPGAAGTDPATSLHIRNWMQCIRSREKTHAPAEAGYDQSVACIMVNAAARTRQYATFDEERGEVMAGTEVFRY